MMLDQVLAFVRTRCSRICTITAIALKGTQYDLLADTIWPSIVKAIITRMPLLFNAGTPDIFHHNYRTSMLFVSQFERLCPSAAALQNLRSKPSYTDFMRKWQLSIYFQIRYLEQVKDMLASVKTIEEGLKRYKKTRKAAPSAEGLSDDDRIRLQIQLDVEQYARELRQLGVNPETDAAFVEMRAAAIEALGK
nr:Conserved oligomeric Golgi complex subunit 2 [Polyrhizophydium stewartii]